MFVMRINAEDDNTFFLEMSSDNTTVMLQMKSSALDLIKMGIKSYKQDKELVCLFYLIFCSFVCCYFCLVIVTPFPYIFAILLSISASV